MNKTYKGFLGRNYIERESEKAILVNVSIFKMGVPKKVVIKQEFALTVSILLGEDTKFTDLTTNTTITARDIIEHFKQNIQETNLSKIETKANMFKQEYKQNIQNNYQQQLSNTYQQNVPNTNTNDFDTPNGEFNEEDLI